MIRTTWAMLKRLHADERGAEGLEKLLIIAAIVLPLLGILLIFKDAVIGWASDAWEKIVGQSQTADPTLTVPNP